MGFLRITVCALGLAAFASGCRPASVFACRSDDECVTNTEAGVCEQATGYCSFNDSACPSGRRYGSLAGGEYGDQCVTEPGSSPTSGEPPRGTMSTESSVTLPTQGSGITTSAGPSETDPLDDATAGPEATSEDGSTSSSSTSEATTEAESTDGSSTGSPPVACAPFIDDFADGVVGQSWSPNRKALTSEAGGELEMQITAAFDGWVRLDYGGALDLTANYVRFELGTGPDDSAAQLGMYVTAGDGSDHYLVMYEGDVLFTRHRQADPTTVHQATFNPTAHRWVQLRGENGRVFIETSPDGVAFEELYSETAAFDLVDVSLWIGASNWRTIPQDETVSIRTFEACGAPP